MKKTILFIAIAAIASQSFSQTDNSWRLGVHFSAIGNSSNFSGGSSDANALFSHQDYVSPSLGVTWRYFYNSHWSLQSGLALGSLGFQFSMAKDYSLLNNGSQNVVNSAGFGTAQIPLTVLYDFKPNCKNARLFVGAGVAVLTKTNSSLQTVNTQTNNEASVSSNVLYLNQTVNSRSEERRVGKECRSRW